MCGIAGELSFFGVPDRATLERQTASLAHRGPDDSGVFLDGPCGLGSRRLAILDLSPAGHMPMLDEERGLALVYNGEIYNSPELRRELEARGEKVRSRGDTEVLLRLLALDGPRALERLRGMFAFALWDGRRRRLLLARDGFGVKPLYLWRDGRRLLFASEIKGLLAHPAVGRRLSPDGVVDYFTVGHTIAPDTMYEGVTKLPAGTWLEAAADGTERRETWFDPLDLYPAGAPERRPAGEWVEEARAVLAGSVRAHLLSDVPLGVYLSGGVDSSAIAMLLARNGTSDLRTYSVGFEGPAAMNELPEARIVARAAGSRHREVLLRPEDLAGMVLPLVRHFDEPPGDAARFPTYALSKAVQGEVKVVLTGEGGDEMFGGYRRYAAEGLWPAYRALRPLVRPALAAAAAAAPGVGRIVRGLSALDRDDPAERALAWQWALAPEAVAALLDPGLGADPRGVVTRYRAHHDRAAARLDRMATLLHADQKVRMSDGYCEKVDRSTMAASLEARVPFIDREVARFAARVPSPWKVRRLALKRLLRRSLEGIVPREVLYRPKRGFAVPLVSWFGGRLESWVSELLRPEEAQRHGILRPEAVRQILARRDAGRAEAVWLLLAFELWRREHLP